MTTILIILSVVSILAAGIILKETSYRKWGNRLKHGDSVTVYGVNGKYLGRVSDVSHVVLGDDKIKYTVFEDDVLPGC